jgi:flagellar M-ring protein FliF
VAVVDQRGNLLSNFDEQSELVEAERQLKHVKRIEDNLNDRIERILLPVVGEGKFKAEVSARVDFTEVEQTDEVFNPDLPAIRSEQTLDEQKVGSGINGGIPGALSNQPPGAANAPEEAGGAQGENGNAQPSNSRRQATRNYELDRTISYTKHQIGKLKRLTVAVVVDDIITAGTEGEVIRTPWTENELARLAILVKDAVGFDLARGDSVNVINSPFVATADDGYVFEEPPFYQQQWFQPYFRAGLGALGLLFILLFVVRPVFKNLSAGAKKVQEEDEARALAAAGSDFDPDGADGGTLAMVGEESLLLPSPSESYEQQLNAVKGLIAEDPGRVAQVVKQWVNAGE